MSTRQEKPRCPKVGVVMGSDSDLPIVQEVILTLEGFGIEYEVTITSAHRSPQKTLKYGFSAKGRNLEVIIACAGGAAHLAGVLASTTILPVIGVPLESGGLQGIDALYSIVQMPRGVPVATMAIGKSGAINAAIFAAQILALKYPEVRTKLEEYKGKLVQEIEAKNHRLNSGNL